MYSLKTAKQVTISRDWSRYRVFDCFSTLSFILLGASAKSRCFNLTPQYLSSMQVKTVNFTSKITLFEVILGHTFGG